MIERAPHFGRSVTGLEEWEAIDPDALTSGTPVQRGRLAEEAEEDDAAGYLAGVWDCTAFTAHPWPHPSDEFMLLLEGSVIMRMPDGSEITVGRGEAFVLPKALDCQWVQPGYVRKVFVIVDMTEGDPLSPERPDPSLARVTVPDLAPPPEEGPVAACRTWFEHATGRMTVAVRSHAGGATLQAAAPAHELLHALEGEVTLTAGDAETRLGAGETAHIRTGTPVARAVEPGTRVVEARHRP